MSKIKDEKSPVHLTTNDVRHFSIVTDELNNMNIGLRSLHRQIEEVEQVKDDISLCIIKYVESEHQEPNNQKLRCLLSKLVGRCQLLVDDLEKLVVRNNKAVEGLYKIDKQFQVKLDKLAHASHENGYTRANGDLHDFSANKLHLDLMSFKCMLKRNKNLATRSVELLTRIKRYIANKNEMLSRILTQASVKPSMLYNYKLSVQSLGDNKILNQYKAQKSHHLTPYASAF